MADHNPDNIRAHLFWDHDWSKPFGSTPDRKLRQVHDDMHGKDNDNG